MDVLFYLLMAAFLYVFYRVWQGFYRIFREYFVLWNVAIGARQDRRSISAKVRLHAYVCKTDLLDEVSVNELYRFLMTMIDTEVTINEFHKLLLSYKFAITCRERKDGSLRGVFFLDVGPREHDGQSYTLVRIGLSFFENFYRGGPLLYYVVAYHVFMELLRHPWTPLYITGKAFSYKSYLAMAKSVKEAYPRFDAETPPFIKKIMDSYALSVKRADEEYDSETCVLKRELSHMKESIAPISPADLSNPHIQFFNRQNPGWRKGHQLILVAKVTWMDLLHVLFKGIGRNKSGRVPGAGDSAGGGNQVDNPRRSPSSPKSPKLKYTRQFTFQCETTSRFATSFSEMDIGGEHKERESRSRTLTSQVSWDIYDKLQL
jgi:hypothetical protein